MCDDRNKAGLFVSSCYGFRNYVEDSKYSISLFASQSNRNIYNVNSVTNVLILLKELSNNVPELQWICQVFVILLQILSIRFILD